MGKNKQQQVFTVGPNFMGVKMIPPGVHLVTTQAVQAASRHYDDDDEGGSETKAQQEDNNKADDAVNNNNVDNDITTETPSEVDPALKVTAQPLASKQNCAFL